MNIVLECVLNVSEGRNQQVIADVSGQAGRCLLDVHADPDHNRCVITLAGPPEQTERAARAVARAAVELIDLTRHSGVHPRIGALDVVPWVTLVPSESGDAGELGPARRAGGGGAPAAWPGDSKTAPPSDRKTAPPDGGKTAAPARPGSPLLLSDGPIAPSLTARDDFARWAATEIGLPCFLYGPERSLPEIRREAWKTRPPDYGPACPHPTAGAAAVGARPALVAYNLWLAGADLATARRVAARIRSPHVRALGLAAGDSVQVSCNLTAPWQTGPGAVFDAVAQQAGVARAELVGLVPLGVLEAEPRRRWAELDLRPSATIEARLEQAGLDGGRFESGRG